MNQGLTNLDKFGQISYDEYAGLLFHTDTYILLKERYAINKDKYGQIFYDEDKIERFLKHLKFVEVFLHQWFSDLTELLCNIFGVFLFNKLSFKLSYPFW
jgi:hypothetical protein